MVHVCVGLYGNGDYVVNMVDDKDLEDNIRYNSVFRPGRFYYVDGKYACGGNVDSRSEERTYCTTRSTDCKYEPNTYASRNNTIPLISSMWRNWQTRWI